MVQLVSLQHDPIAHVERHHENIAGVPIKQLARRRRIGMEVELGKRRDIATHVKRPSHHEQRRQ
jgi:hypothetical protein